MDYFVIYDIASGESIMTDHGPGGGAGIQLEEGWAVMAIPREAMRPLGRVDLETIKTSYNATVDADADKVRGLVITNYPGQIGTYLEKEAEARRILAGNTSDLCYLSLEAQRFGVTLEERAQVVIDTANEWRPINGRIEDLRVGAKKAITEATNLTQIAQATKINWQAAITPE
jgi:hypothetical protein